MSTLSQLGDRYFVTIWEHGLTENQDNEYDNQPVEVFNPKFKQYISYRTVFYDKDGKIVDSFDGLLNEHIEEDKS